MHYLADAALAATLERAALALERDAAFSMRSDHHDIRAAVLAAFAYSAGGDWAALGHGALGERLGLGHAVGHALFTGPRDAGGATAEDAARVLRYAAGGERPGDGLAGRWARFLDRAAGCDPPEHDPFAAATTTQELGERFVADFGDRAVCGACDDE